MRASLTVAASAIVACASPVSNLPYCAQESALQPLPTAACQSSPEVGEYEEVLSDLLARDAGPLLVRVELGMDSRIREVCTDPSITADQWMSRDRIARKLTAAYALPSAPACLVGNRIDLNRPAASLAEADAILEECGREASLRRQSDEYFGSQPNMAGKASGRAFQTCLQQHQNRRNELWIFSLSAQSPLIFAKTENSAPSRTALLVCTNARETSNSLIGVTRDPASTILCMREHGWEPLE